jgi:hypothetical protein
VTNLKLANTQLELRETARKEENFKLRSTNRALLVQIDNLQAELQRRAAASPVLRQPTLILDADYDVRNDLYYPHPKVPRENKLHQSFKPRLE